MRAQRRFAAGLLAALAAGWLCAGCAPGPGSAPQLEARLWKRARPPVELVAGDLVAAGDELYLTVIPRRTLYVYLLNRDARGERQILYPCRGWGRSRPLAGRLRHRLPPPLLGRETFWPVRAATADEHLLVLACARPAATLDEAVQAAAGTPPCAAPLGSDAGRWLEGLSLVDLSASGGPRGPHASSWRAQPSGEEGWLLDFNLVGAADHG
ncbi:MAG TPA: DUF4384 domain-containing protein [Thermoanaerobaculia bacterium]|nr:DUF4384 domain-containing protein [Thermoanaerobaculia bacterium]